MSDSCRSCRFVPGKDCPIGSLYWAFLARNEPALRDNLRMKLPLAGARQRADDLRAADAATFVALRDVLIRGRPAGEAVRRDANVRGDKGAK
jgi:deoxyribodipyrimidine photolyase-like uncharacterized protein